MKEKYVTITGFRAYQGLFPFKIGFLVRCEKEPDNPYDGEAIRCTMPMIGTVGYLANSTGTVAGGTMSAGRIYDKADRKGGICFPHRQGYLPLAEDTLQRDPQERLSCQSAVCQCKHIYACYGISAPKMGEYPPFQAYKW